MDAVLDMLGHVPQVLVGSVLASAGFLLSVLAPIVTYYLPTLRSDVPALLQKHKLALERKDHKQQQQQQRQRESEKPAESVHSADSSDTAHSTDSSATLYPSTDNDSRELSPRSPSEPPDSPKTPVASKSKFPQCVVKKRKSASRSLSLPSTSSPSSPVSKPPRSPPPPLPLPPASANVWRTELSPIEDSALALDPDHARGRDAEAVHTAKTTGMPDNSGSAAVAQEKIPRRRSMRDLCREKRRERKLKRSLSTPLPPPLPSPSTPSSSSVALPADSPQPEAKSARRKTPFLHPTRSPKNSTAKLPPARTQPYAAPYFFPSPGSAEATDYVKLVKDERRGLQQQNGTVLHQRHQVQSLSPCHIPSPLSASHPRRVASEDLGSPTRLVESPEMEHAPPPPAARVTVEEPAAFLRPGRTAAERQSWAGSTDAMETKDAAAAAKASPSRPLFKRLAKSHV